VSKEHALCGNPCQMAESSRPLQVREYSGFSAGVDIQLEGQPTLTD